MSTQTGNPDWFDAISADYSAGVAHGFLVHGNVHDYVEDDRVDVTPTAYLAGRLAGRYSVVAFSPDQGITFPGADSDDPERVALATAARKRFEAVTKLGAPELDPLERLAQEAGGLQTGPGPDLPRVAAAAIPKLIEFLEQAYGGTPIYRDEVSRVVDPVTGEAEEVAVTIQDGTDPEDPGDGTGMRALVIVERLDLICPPGDKATLAPGDRALLAALHRVGTTAAIQGRSGMLVMLTPSLSEIHADLKATSTGLRSVAIAPPMLEQRRAYLERLLADTERGLELGDDITLAQIAAGTAGLGYRHIEDIALRAVHAADGVLTRDLVRGRRKELMEIEYDGILEVMDADVTLDMVGGHELAIEYLKEEVIGLIKSGDPELIAAAPMGVLLAGPSGTGKTFLARGIAHELEFEMFVIRMANVKGKFVGESEQKLEKLIQGIEANAPCLVFMDEVDQSVRRGTGGGSGGDSVDNNMFGRLLEWLGEPSHRGRILAVAATNRPDNLDAAFLRPGRFDAKIPLLVAQSAREREEMLVRLLKRAGGGWDAPQVATVAAGTEGWTAAELENLVTVARRLVLVRKLDMGAALVAARARLKAATRDVEAMTLLALSICDDLALVPADWQQYVAEAAPGPNGGGTDAATSGPARPVGPRRGGPQRSL